MAKAWPLVTLVVMVFASVATGGSQTATPATSSEPRSPHSALPTRTAPEFEPTTPDPVRGAWLLARAVEAVGGPAAVDAARTLEIHAKGTHDLGSSGRLEVRTTTFVAPPDRYRQEVVAPGAAACTLLNPEGAFFILVNKEMTPLKEDDRRRLIRELRRNVIVLLQGRTRPGFHAVKVGRGAAADTTLEMVELGAADDDHLIVGIDPTTGFVRQVIATEDAGAEAARSVVTHSDYRDVGAGLKYPFQSTGRLNDQQVLSSTVEKVSVNGPLDPLVFARPTPTNFWRPDLPIPPDLPATAPPSTLSTKPEGHRPPS